MREKAIDKEYRRLCFTLNNWGASEKEALINWNWKGKAYYSYLVFGEEIGEKKGTPHLQGYVEFPNSRQFSVLKKFNSRIKWIIPNGTAKQCANYCKKGEQTKEEWKEFKIQGPNYGKNAKVFEAGTISNAGHRTDLDELAKQVAGGMKVDDILIENPTAYHQYGRTLAKAEDLALRKKFRTWMTLCIWYYGPTGTGKSERAFEGYNPDTHYVFPNDGGWWDGYTGQEIVIINDFRGDLIRYNDLLQLVDKYPMTVRRRCREPMPFLAKKIIITSSMHPEEVFHHRNENDSIAQLLRRVEIVKTGGEGSKETAEVAKGNTKTLAVNLCDDIFA